MDVVMISRETKMRKSLPNFKIYLKFVDEEPKAVASVNVSGQVRWLSISCDGLTVFLATLDQNKTSSQIAFYDVRTLLDQKQPNGTQKYSL